jgi:hypothetical protein
LDGKVERCTISILWSTSLQGGRASRSFYIKTSKKLLNESKIQVGGFLAPCGLGSPWETFKNIETRKLDNSNSLAKATKLTPTFANVKLCSTYKFINLELILAHILNLLLVSIIENVKFIGIQKCVP